MLPLKAEKALAAGWLRRMNSGQRRKTFAYQSISFHSSECWKDGPSTNWTEQASAPGRTNEASTPGENSVHRPELNLARRSSLPLRFTAPTLLVAKASHHRVTEARREGSILGKQQREILRHFVTGAPSYRKTEARLCSSGIPHPDHLLTPAKIAS